MYERIWAVYLIKIFHRTTGELLGWYVGETNDPRTRLRAHLSRSNNEGVRLLLAEGHSLSFDVLYDNLTEQEAYRKESEIITGLDLPTGLDLKNILNSTGPSQISMLVKTANDMYKVAQKYRTDVTEDINAKRSLRRVNLIRKLTERVQGMIEDAIEAGDVARVAEEHYNKAVSKKVVTGAYLLERRWLQASEDYEQKTERAAVWAGRLARVRMLKL